MYPSIVLNTVASGIGFVSSGGAGSKVLSYLIAVMNIASAMLTSVQRIKRSTENAEAHALYSKIFSSFTRKISLELSLHPEDRRECIEFCKICRDEYDKAVTDSLPVPTFIIEEFRKTFKDEPNKPEVANGLFHFNNYDMENSSREIKKKVENYISQNHLNSPTSPMNLIV
jgi:hypothetical protein